MFRLFEGPKIDMANLLSMTINIVSTAFFFAPLLPISIPIALVGTVLSYWIDKVNFICQ
jgi:hypothetical protein